MSWLAFIYGAARVFDLFGTMPGPVDLPATDEEAFRRDWQALCEDWRKCAAAERQLPSPDKLVDAKHDPIHPTSGRRLRSKKIKRRC